MKPLCLVAACVFVLAILYAPISAQSMNATDSGNDDDDDDDDDTWRKVAIILPIIFGGLSLLIFFCYCCCCRGGGQGWGCGDCSRWGCWDCRNCGNCGNFGDCRNCGYACGCGDCFGECCRGCCLADDRIHHSNQRMVYSSSQGPIKVEEADRYGAAFPQPMYSGYSNVSSIPVNGVDRYPVYGGIRTSGVGPGAYGVYSSGPPVLPRPGGCGCGGGMYAGSPYSSGGCGCSR